MDSSEVYASLNKLRWTNEPMTLLQMTESLEMPQIARIMRSNVTELPENDYLLLQSVYDRYLILAQTPSSSSNASLSYLIPDWYRAQCRIKTAHPKIQKQFWNFQGASEINRFDFPREINFLVETPIYQFSSKLGNKAEWKRVVVKRNTKIDFYLKSRKVVKIQNYSVENTNRGNCFILLDKQGNKFLLPSEFNIKFSVEIKPEEYISSYFDHKGIFSIPEIITRYELPIDIEFVAGTEPGSIPASKLPRSIFKFISVAIGKSIIGATFNTANKKYKHVEISPATQIRLSIPKCLQHGLLNPNVSLSKEEENEYTLYNKTREASLALCHKQCELFKFEMRTANNEEREAMVKIYDAGFKFKTEEAEKLKENFLLDLKSKEAINPDARIPFIGLKNIFLRPNIDEGDPYDDVTQEGKADDGKLLFAHDLSILPQMPEKLLVDSMVDVKLQNIKQK